MNNRKFTRVPYTVTATITCGGRSFSGEVANMSLHGMLVRAPEMLNVDDAVEIVISMAGDDPEFRLTLSGIVVRSEEQSLGIKFEKMDVDSFMHLRRIVEFNSPDPGKVMGEFFDFIEARVKAD